jgi:hypothetical protein
LIGGEDERTAAIVFKPVYLAFRKSRNFTSTERTLFAFCEKELSRLARQVGATAVLTGEMPTGRVSILFRRRAAHKRVSWTIG